MKKKLALILSIVLALSVAICIFAFSASAEELPYAETQAANLWGSSEITKATSVTVGSNTVIDLTTDGSGSITEGGTYAVKDGKLTLTNVGTSANVAVNPNGGLWVEVNNGGAAAKLSFTGILQNNNAGAMGQKRSPLIITSADGAVLNCTNVQNHHGDIILMGKISMNDTAGGYHKFLIRGNTDTIGKGYDIILGVEGNITLNGEHTGGGNIIENNSGSVIISGKTTVTVKGTGTSIDGVDITSNADAAATFSVLEDASFDISLTNGVPVLQNAKATSAVDNVVIDTSGTVKMKVTGANIVSWAAGAIYNYSGSVAIKNGTVLLDYTASAYDKAGCANIIFVNNAKSFNTVGLKVSGGELAIKTTNNATGSVRLNGTWVNYGVVHFTGNAKVSYDMADTTYQDYPINVKIGEVLVADNAKVFLKGTNRGICIETGELKTAITNNNTEFLNYWRENAGLHVTGGQLDVIGSMLFDMATAALDEKYDGQSETKWLVKKNFTISDGVVLAHLVNDGTYVSGLGFNAAENVTNQLFIGNLVRTKTYTYTSLHGGYDRQWNDNTSGIKDTARPDWAYIAKDAQYTYYNGVAANADFFGAAANVDGALVDVTYDANGKATYKYTVPLSANYNLNGNVYAFVKDSVLLSDEPLTVAMTDSAVDAGYVYFADTDGIVTNLIDDKSDAVASTHTAKNGGTISYDAATGLVGVNGVDGQTLETRGPGDFTVDFNGTNNFSVAIWARNAGAIVYKGDDNTKDIVNINTAAQYAFGASGSATAIEVKGFTLNVTTTNAKGDAIHNSEGDNTFTFGKDAVVNATAPVNALRIRAKKGTFITENAQITATATLNSALHIQQGSLTIDGTAVVKAYANGTPVSGDLNPGSEAIRASNATISGAATVLAEGKTNVFNVTGGSFNVSGTANVTVNSLFGDADYAYAQTLSDGEQGKPETWTGAKRGYIRYAGVNILKVNGSIDISGGTVTVNGNNESLVALTGNLNVSGGELTATSITEQRADGYWTEVGPSDDPGKYLSSSYNTSNLTGCNVLRMNGNVNISGGKVTLTGHMRALHMDGGTVNVTGGELNVNARYNALQNAGRVVNVDGGVVNVKGSESVVMVGTLNVKSGTINVSADKKSVNATSQINVSGGKLVSEASVTQAIYTDTLNVTGGVIDAAAAVLTNYTGVASVKNYNQTAGEVYLTIKGVNQTATTVGLHFYEGTGSNFEGGKLIIKAIDSIKAGSTYGIWSNSTDLNFNGTNVEIDTTGIPVSSTYVAGIKIQGGKTINVNDGHIYYRGSSQHTMYRADTGTLNLNGGESVGVGGYFAGTNDDTVNVINVTDNAKVDYYYYNGVKTYGKAAPAETVTDKWLKNCTWNDAQNWLTTGNWGNTDVKIRLTLNDGSIFEMDKDTDNRTYPAGSATPYLAMSMAGEVIILDATPLNTGIITRIESKGDMRMNIPSAVTVNLGNTSAQYVFDVNGSLTLFGSGTLNVTALSRGIVALDDLIIEGPTVAIETGEYGNAINVQRGDLTIRGGSKVTANAKSSYEGIVVSKGNMYVEDSTIDIDVNREGGIRVVEGTYNQTNSAVSVKFNRNDGSTIHSGGLVVGADAHIVGGSLSVDQGNCASSSRYDPIRVTGTLNMTDADLIVKASGENGNTVKANFINFNNVAAEITSNGNGVIIGDNGTTISKSNVTATGSDNIVVGYGDAGLTIQDSVINATATKTSTVRGNDIHITDSTVNATSGTQWALFTNGAGGNINIHNSTIDLDGVNGIYSANGNLTMVGSDVTVDSVSKAILVVGSLSTYDTSLKVTTTGEFESDKEYNAVQANGNISFDDSQVTVISAANSDGVKDTTPVAIYAKGDLYLNGDDSVLVVKTLATAVDTYGPRAIESGANMYFDGGKLFINCDEGSTVTVNADGTITANLVNPTTSVSKFTLKSGGIATSINFSGTDAVIAGYEQTVHTQGGGINVSDGTVSVVATSFIPLRIQGAGELYVNGGTLNLVGYGSQLQNYKQYGGTLNADGTSSDAFNCSADNITFEIFNGNFNVTGGSCGLRLKANVKGEFNVIGGNVNISAPGQVLYLNGSGTNNVNLSGGTTTITHNTVNAYRPIQVNGTGTVNLSGEAKLYAYGNGFASIQATNFKISDSAYAKVTTKANGSGAYYAITATNMNVAGGTLELSAGSTSVVNATNYTQTAGTVSMKTQDGGWTTGLRSMNANVTGGSMDFALTQDAFEAANGNEAEKHNGVVNIGGNAKITGYAPRFFDGNADAQLNISGDPTIDFYNYDGTSVRDGNSKIDTADVQFVEKCRPQDKSFFITTANAVVGDAPSQIVVVDNSKVPHFLYDEDGKREFGGATRTGAKDVTVEGINVFAIRANGSVNMTVKGSNVINSTQNFALATFGGNLAINGTASDTLSVTGNQRVIATQGTDKALNVTGLKLIANGNEGYAINPSGTGTFTNATLVVGCDDGSTFASITNGIAKDYIVQANGGLIFKNTKAIVYGNSNLLHSNGHAVGIQILEGSKIDVVAQNTRAIRAQHGNLLVSGAGTVVNVKAVAATWGESCVHVQGQTDVSDFIISDGAVVNMESNGAANSGIVAINEGSLILDNGQLLLNNKGSSPTAKSNKLGLIDAPKGNVSITNDSYLEMKGSGNTYANVVAGGDMVVEDSKIKIEKTHDDALRITGKLVIKDSDAEIYGGWNNAITANKTIEIDNSVVNVNAYKGYAMQGVQGITIVDSTLYVNAKRTSTIDNIVPDVALDDANGYAIQTKGNLVVDNSTVIAYGKHNVIHMDYAAGAMSFINGSKVAVCSDANNGIRAQSGDIVVTDATLLVEALYNVIYTDKGKVIINSGFVSAQTNASDAHFKAAQDAYEAIANPTWADANTKKSNVRNYGSSLIRGGSAVEINGGTVLAGTENGMGNENAIYSGGTFKMTGGTVKAYVMYTKNPNALHTDNETQFNKGPASRDTNNMTGCYGIRIKGNVDITGGELIIGARTQGILSDSGNINIGGDAKVDIKVTENAGIRALANTNLTIDCAELTINARNDAIVKEGSNKNTKVDILGGDIVVNADYEAIDVSGGTLTFGGDANVTVNVVDGFGIYTQYAAAKLVIKDNVKLNVNQTAMKSTWRSAITAFDLEMLGGDVNIDIDSAPFAKYEQRVLVGIGVQGSDVYNLGVMNLKGGNIHIDIDNNYNDAGYTVKDGNEDKKDTSANRTFGLFFKNVSTANFDGTNVECDIHTLMANGTSGHISVQGNDAVINVNGGKLAFNATGDITSLFAHTVSGGKINLNGGEITGSANYFWHALGGMNKVLTVKPGMKIDFFNYSGDAVNLGTYNANNQTYHNWYVDDGVEYLTGCSLKNNTQFVTTGNMTVDGAATQVEIKVKEGSALKTYALTVLAQDPDNSSVIPNRAYPAGAGPMDAKAYLKANGELILNDLAAQSLVFNGDIDVDLNGTSTLVKNGTHTIHGYGDVTIGGDGVLEMSGTDYVLYALGNEITFNDKAQVKIIATKGNGIHLNNTEATTAVNILDDAKVVIEATENFSVDKDGKVTYSNNGRGIYIRGIDTSLNVGDNAVLDVTSTDQAIYVLSNNGTEGDVTKATVNIGGNAQVNLEGAYGIVTNGLVSTANVNGNAVVTMPEVTKSFYATGADASVNIGGNAKVLVDKSTGDGLTIQSNVIAPEGVKQNASLTVSGKANYVITDATSCGARIAITATDLDKKTVPGTTAFIVSDEANVEMNAGGQTVYLLANGTGGSAKFAITDKATATIVNDSPTSQYGAAVQINSPENDVDITTSGIVNVQGKAATWQGAFFVTGGAVSTDVLIKDATLNITNIQDTEFETLDANKKNTFGGEISNAMMISGKGKVEITGDAVFNAYAERNGTKYNNRAHGLFLTENMELIISGNADATFAAGGDSKANTGAGIHLKQSKITVTDNATLRTNATGTAVAGITFEGVSSLAVNKYGVVLVDGGKNAVGIRGYNKSADVDIIVKDGGHAQFTGKPALDLKAGTFEYSVSKVIAGKDKESSKETAITVVQREYKDMGYVVLKGQMRNPSTSDYVITYVVVAAILAAAAAVAVIVIRKKKSQD